MLADGIAYELQEAILAGGSRLADGVEKVLEEVQDGPEFLIIKGVDVLDGNW